jgi:hypothetical protein
LLWITAMTTQSDMRRVSLADSELTLSGVLTIGTLDTATHIPLGSALELSLQVVRLVAQTHDQGEVVGVLDAAHLICAPTGSLTFGGHGGNPIAPELKRGDMPDRLTDVYALGALIYRLLTGKRVDPTRLVEPPSHFNPAVDTSLDELVLEALDEDPSERPYSARELERRMVEIFEELGLEPESDTEAVRLIKQSVAAKPGKKSAAAPVAARRAPAAAVAVAVAAPVRVAAKPVAPKRAPPPLRFADAEATTDYGDDDDDYPSHSAGGSVDKKWLIIGGVALVAIVLLVVSWPSSKKSHHSASAPAAAEVVKADAPAPAPTKVEARMVDPTPAVADSDTSTKTTVKKLLVKSTVRNTRSGRR